MNRMYRSAALGLTSISIAAVIVVAFLWVGPGVSAFPYSASADELFDGEEVSGIYEQVSPAVVEVSTSSGSGIGLRRLGSGSGFLIDSEGYIITNNHVVADADNVTVKFGDGETAGATIIGRSPANDLALLQVDATVVKGIVPVTLGNSSALKPGQLAIAIGSPFGLDGSITVGVISQLNRDLPSLLRRPISNVIQTDALINPGNSGGALLDSTGSVVGINTALQVSSSTGTNSGVGFAVPVDTLTGLLPQLKEGGVISPPWLGIQATDIDAALAAQLELPVDSGVYVTGVVSDGPADEAGVVEAGTNTLGNATTGGDIITQVNGTSVDTVADLVAELNNYQPGDQITLSILRGGETIEVAATLEAWPEDLNLVIERKFGGEPEHDFRGFRGPDDRRFGPNGRSFEDLFPWLEQQDGPLGSLFENLAPRLDHQLDEGLRQHHQRHDDRAHHSPSGG